MPQIKLLGFPALRNKLEILKMTSTQIVTTATVNKIIQNVQHIDALYGDLIFAKKSVYPLPLFVVEIL